MVLQKIIVNKIPIDIGIKLIIVLYFDERNIVIFEFFAGFQGEIIMKNYTL